MRGFLSSVSVFSSSLESLESSFVSNEKTVHLIWDTIRWLGDLIIYYIIITKEEIERSRNSVTTNADHYSSRYHEFS